MEWDKERLWCRGCGQIAGSVVHKHSLKRREKLGLVNEEAFINALGALSGNQAMQQAKAGLKAVYLLVGRSQVMQTMREKCILISHYILLVQFLML